MPLPADGERFKWTAAGLACIFAAFCPGLVVGTALAGWMAPYAETLAQAVEFIGGALFFCVMIVSGVSLIFIAPFALLTMFILWRLNRLRFLWIFFPALAVGGLGCEVILDGMANDPSLPAPYSHQPAFVWGSRVCVLVSAALAAFVMVRLYRFFRQYA